MPSFFACTWKGRGQSYPHRACVGVANMSSAQPRPALRYALQIFLHAVVLLAAFSACAASQDASQRARVSTLAEHIAFGASNAILQAHSPGNSVDTAPIDFYDGSRCVFLQVCLQNAASKVFAPFLNVPAQLLWPLPPIICALESRKNTFVKYTIANFSFVWKWRVFARKQWPRGSKRSWLREIGRSAPNRRNCPPRHRLSVRGCERIYKRNFFGRSLSATASAHRRARDRTGSFHLSSPLRAAPLHAPSLHRIPIGFIFVSHANWHHHLGLGAD